MAGKEDGTFTDNVQEEIDDSFRLVAIGNAILCEAEANPAFYDWLAGFLDRHVADDERYLFDFLAERGNRNVLPFPAIPPETE